MKKLLKSLLRPFRIGIGRMPVFERNYIGTNGCLHTAASFVAWNQVPGDYLEFGVYQGASFAAAFDAVEWNRRMFSETRADEIAKSEELRSWMAVAPRYFAFDSFAGLPAGEVGRQSDYGEGSYACSEDDFRTNMASSGVDLGRVISVSGLYDVSLTKEIKERNKLTRAAIVMVDCDLYESTVPVLRFITDLVVQGTIIVFHDWFRFKGSPEHGEQRACREWLRDNSHIELIEYWREGPQAMSFIVNIRESL